MEYGHHFYGIKKQVSEQASLNVGNVYQVDIEARGGILDADSVINFLLGKMNEAYPELRVQWISVSTQKQTITLQFTPVPAQTLGFEPRTERLFVGAILAWLPSILTLIGIAVAGISIWNIIGAIPWWGWALLGTGIILLIFGPSIAKLFEERAPAIYRAPRKYPVAYRYAY